MTGWQLSDFTRTYEGIEPKPVVVRLTADTGLSVRKKCLASGMADVIHKPITVVGMQDYFDHALENLIALRTTIAEAR